MTDPGAARSGPFTIVVHAATALLAGLTVLTGAAAFVSGWFLPAIAAVTATAVVAVVRPVRASGPVPRAFQLLFTLGVIAVGLVLARLAVFMLVPTAPGWSLVPATRFWVQHSCVSAYYVAGAAVARVADVYDDALYSFPQDDTTGPRLARMIGPFRIDPYEYPPTFLPLPRLLRWLAPDFFDFRRLWRRSSSIRIGTPSGPPSRR